MWRSIHAEFGSKVRDELWDHPDVLPTAAEIDNPKLLFERIRRASGAPDAIDVALRDLLGE
jgi:uncharacterized protein (DUF2342 family)